MEQADYQLIHSDAALKLASYGNLLISIWQETPTSVSLLRVGSACRDIAARGHKVISIVYVTRLLGFPTESTRRAIAASRRELNAETEAVAIILPDHGFWVSAAASILTSIMRFSRADYPTHIFATAEEALAWKLDKVIGQPNLNDVQEIFDAVTCAEPIAQQAIG